MGNYCAPLVMLRDTWVKTQTRSAISPWALSKTQSIDPLCLILLTMENDRITLRHYPSQNLIAVGQYDRANGVFKDEPFN